MAKSRKVIITCAVTGAIHTPSMSPHLPITADEIAEGALGAARGGCGDRASARARSARRAPVAGARAVHPVPEEDQGRLQRGDQPHHRRRADDAGAGAGPSGAGVQAGGRVAQHGLDELRPVRDAGPHQGVEARLGAAVPRGELGPHFPQYLRRHRLHPRVVQQQRHALRDRVLRHQPPLHGGAFPRSRAGEAAACSSSRCSACAAASARIPRTCCTCGAPPIGCSATATCGRCSARVATR